MNNMSFRRYMTMVQIGEISLYVLVGFSVYAVIMPLFNMGLTWDIILTILILYVAFSFGSAYRKRMIAIDASKRSMYFFNTLDTSSLQGMSEYFVKKAKKSTNRIMKSNNEFMAYLLHDYISSEEFDLLSNIKVTEEAYDDYYFDRVIFIRSIMIYREMEQGKIQESLDLCKRQLAYIEKMIDIDEVPEIDVEIVLNYSSVYRHMIRFIESPNIRTALAIKVPENTTNYDKVNKYFYMAKVFIANDMIEDAKFVIEKVLDLEGDYRLLTTLKDYYKTV